ncbi:MAG: type II secretion system protein GspL [Pseudomonadota bacterium]
MSFLLVLAPGDEARIAMWFDQASGEGGENTPLEDVARRCMAAGKATVVAALPGDAAISRVMRLPMKRQRDVVRAAALALDDAQAEVIEDRLIALGTETDGRRLVTALPRSSVAEWLEILDAEGIDPDVVTVDHALLPSTDEDEMVYLALGGREAVMTAEGAFTADHGFVEHVRALMGERQERRIALADAVDANAVPNFRTGALAKRKPLPNLRPFASAAVLALAAGILFLVATLTEGLRYRGASQALVAEAEAAFERAFPGTPVVDLERQIRSRRGRPSLQSTFLPLTAIVAEVIADQNGTRITNMTYQPEGELTAEMTFRSIGDLETFTAKLDGRGVIAEERSAVRSDGDGAFIAQLTLRAS